MTRYWIRHGGLAWVECSRKEYVKIEKELGVHPGGHDNPTTTWFKSKGFFGHVTKDKVPKKDELDGILEEFLAKGKL